MATPSELQYFVVVVQSLMQVTSTCFLGPMLFHIGQVLLLSYFKNVLPLLQCTTISGGENGCFLAGVATNGSMQKVLFAWNAERQKKFK